MKLFLPAPVAAEIARAARDAFPRECCGLIEGVWDEGAARALALHPAPNRANEADRFVIDPVAHIAAQKAARANGHALIGCYHSHPNGKAEPSGSDRQGAAGDFIWLIAALDGVDGESRLKAWRYFDGGFVAMGLMTGADLVTSSSKEL